LNYEGVLDIAFLSKISVGEKRVKNYRDNLGISKYYSIKNSGLQPGWGFFGLNKTG
jgi:hypothetical protein